MNPMKRIRIEKLTLNVGTGVNQDNLKKAIKLLTELTGMAPVKTISNKRIPSWGVRPGLPLGCKLIIRGKKAEELLTRLLAAKENSLNKNCFDEHGNVSFGIHEYIDIPEFNYDTSIGMMGLQVTVTLSRPGFRIKHRKRLTRKVGKNHRINQQDSIAYFNQTYKIKVGE